MSTDLHTENCDPEFGCDETCTTPLPPQDALASLIAFLQERRAASLRAIRACDTATTDYWRWQGHAELARQLLERLGAEVPR